MGAESTDSLATEILKRYSSGSALLESEAPSLMGSVPMSGTRAAQSLGMATPAQGSQAECRSDSGLGNTIQIILINP